MKIRSSTIVAALAFCAVLESSALAQTSATQGFRVIVPTTISITAPPTTQVITHDQTDNNQTFLPQNWSVKGNVNTGLNVSFATSTAFVNLADSASKRNVRLGLALNAAQGPARWTITQAADTTNYVANDEVAAVTATSDGAGSANFDLSVTFVTEDYDLFSAGQYVLTVVGTVAAN